MVPIREQLLRVRDLTKQNPWIGYAVLGGVVLLVVLVLSVRFTGGDPAPQALAADVTIRFEDDGKQMQMARGRVEQVMWDRPMPLDPGEGLENPETRKLTGFYPDRAEWKKMVEGIAAQRTR